MTNKYYLADSKEMDERKKLAEEFYNSILDPEEIPFLITDQASLFDIYAGDNNELIQKVKDKYGVILNISDFSMPFYQLLDFLDKKRT